MKAQAGKEGDSSRNRRRGLFFFLLKHPLLPGASSLQQGRGAGLGARVRGGGQTDPALPSAPARSECPARTPTSPPLCPEPAARLGVSGHPKGLMSKGRREAHLLVCCLRDAISDGGSCKQHFGERAIATAQENGTGC